MFGASSEDLGAETETKLAEFPFSSCLLSKLSGLMTQKLKGLFKLDLRGLLHPD